MLLTFHDWLLLYLIVVSSMLLHRSPCTAIGKASGWQVHAPTGLGLVPRPILCNSRCKNATACSFKQKVAHSVLAQVASPVTPKQHSRDHDSKQQQYSTHQNPSSSNKNLRFYSEASNSSSNWPGLDVSDVLLHSYIHRLPAPPVPPAWWQLCQQISASGLNGLQKTLAPDTVQLPDVQGAAAAHCQLGRHPWGYTFDDPVLSAFVASLFTSIVAGRAAEAKQLGAPPPKLDRFDLFHGHIFIAYDCDTDTCCSSPAAVPASGSSGQTLAAIKAAKPITANKRPGEAMTRQSSSSSIGTSGRGARHSRRAMQATSHLSSSSSSSSSCQVGILFHSAEYPSYDENSFPIMLGNCQANSSCTYNSRSMDLRNMIWWQGQLAVLDVGKNSPLHNLLLHEGTRPLRTLYEEDFGKPVADLLLLRRHRRRRRMSADISSWDRQLLAAAAGWESSSRRDSGERHHGVFVSY